MDYLSKLFDLENKVAILTGGGGVLAGKMAEGLAKAGAIIVLLDLEIEKAELKASELSQYGKVIGLECNVLKNDDLEKVRDIVLEKYGSIDILINAAGGNMPGATISPGSSFFDMDMDSFKNVTDLNLNGSVLPSMVFGKVMAEQKKGSIINLSSMAVDRIITRVVGYSASKAAITNFTKWMAVEMAQKFGEGVRVNAIAPGFFIGEQNRRLLTNEDNSLTERGHDIIKNTPMGRFGEPEELIGLTLYLSSNASKFVTGVVMPVDGGFSVYSGV